MNWIAIRDGNPVAVFKNRKQAISWLKEILKQTLDDYKNQDKTDEYNYAVDIKSLKIIPVKNREAFLGL